MIKKGASKFEIRQKPLKTDLAQSYTTGALFSLMLISMRGSYSESFSR